MSKLTIGVKKEIIDILDKSREPQYIIFGKTYGDVALNQLMYEVASRGLEGVEVSDTEGNKVKILPDGRMDGELPSYGKAAKIILAIWELP